MSADRRSREPMRAHLGVLALAAAAALAACAGPRAPAPAAPAPPAPSTHGPPSPPPSPAPNPYGEEAPFSPSPVEGRALEAVTAQLHARPSPALSRAARELARRAAEGEDDPLSRAHLRAALARARAYDPAPFVQLVETSPDAAPRLLADTLRRSGARATHTGVGVEVRSERAFVVALVAERKAALRPFPAAVPPGTTAQLEGELLGTLAAPSVHVTAPSGQSAAVPVRAAGRRFTAPVRIGEAGLWTVEVVGQGARGPEVAALLTVSSGGAALDRPERHEAPEPEELSAAEAQVAQAIDATRRSRGLEPLDLDRALSVAARSHSDEMAARGELAHVFPGSGDLGTRLRRARIPFATARENVARSGTALEAHRTAEESPAHRENVLAPDVTRVGVGLARTQLPTGERVVYLTEIFTRPITDDDDRLTPETRVREALWRARARAGAPPLTTDPALDELARSAARAMLRRGEPDGAGLAERALELPRRVAAADVFVATRAEEAARSKNLTQPRFRRAGVGVAVGDSPRYGAGLLWIAVLYTD